MTARWALALGLLGLALFALAASAGVAHAGPLPVPDVLAQAAIQQAELTATGGAATDTFGCSVAIDGDTALVGANGATVDGKGGQGAAYVFTRSGTGWAQQARLVASDGAAWDGFGYAVALSGDTALVGAWGKDVAGKVDQGGAYVFTRSGSTWTQQTRLIASDGAAGDDFGSAVALDGDTAVIGAFNKTVGGLTQRGCAYAYQRDGTTWTQQARLVAAPDGLKGDMLGVSVAISGDTALVGATGKAVGFNVAQGVAYVFVRSGTNWTSQAKIFASDGAAHDAFGSAVAVEGDTALVGAYLKTVGGAANQGAAYIFTRTHNLWSQRKRLLATDGATTDSFGCSVALSGGRALIGAYGKDVGGVTGQGAAYVFSGSGATWSQDSRLTASDGAAEDYFGYSVDLSGETVLAGAYDKTVAGAIRQGAAYVLGLPCTVTASVVSGHGTINPAGAQTYDYGSMPPYTFTPETGYVVREVKVDGTAVAMTAADAYTFQPLTGDHSISVEFGVPDQTAPKIVKLKPKAGKRGATATITGTGFGAARGTSSVTFGKAKVKKYVSWSDTRVKVKVPKKARFGKAKVTVTTGGGTSNAVRFKVRK